MISRSLLRLLLLIGLPGCSFAFAGGPVTQAADSSDSPVTSCRSERTVPVDTLLGAASTVRAIYVAGTDDSLFPNRRDPRLRNADVGVSLAFAALFFGSAFFGDHVTKECDKARLRARRPRADELRATPPALAPAKGLASEGSTHPASN